MVKIAIIILNWNGVADTLECLKSIYKSKLKTQQCEFVIYVVDNASSDNSVEEIKAKYPQVTLIENQANLGYSGGNNVGIKRGLEDGADWIMLLNNDTTVSETTFIDLFTETVKTKFAITSPKIYFYPGREFHFDSYKKSERGNVIWYAGGRLDLHNIIAVHRGVDEVDHGQFENEAETDFATGCCMLINKKVFHSVGYLDETFRAYYEDNDFCQRARKKGFTVGYIPHAFLWHKNAGSSGGSGSEKQRKLVDKSRLIFAMRHAPFRAKLALIKQQLLHATTHLR